MSSLELIIITSRGDREPQVYAAIMEAEISVCPTLHTTSNHKNIWFPLFLELRYECFHFSVLEFFIYFFLSDFFKFHFFNFFLEIVYSQINCYTDQRLFKMQSPKKKLSFFFPFQYIDLLCNFIYLYKNLNYPEKCIKFCMCKSLQILN